MLQRRKAESVDMGKLRLRKEIADKLMVLLEDPLNPGRMKYGALKNLSDRLFAQYLRDLDALGQDVLEQILKDGEKINE